MKNMDGDSSCSVGEDLQFIFSNYVPLNPERMGRKIICDFFKYNSTKEFLDNYQTWQTTCLCLFEKTNLGTNIRFNKRKLMHNALACIYTTLRIANYPITMFDFSYSFNQLKIQEKVKVEIDITHNELAKNCKHCYNFLTPEERLQYDVIPLVKFFNRIHVDLRKLKFFKENSALLDFDIHDYTDTYEEFIRENPEINVNEDPGILIGIILYKTISKNRSLNLTMQNKVTKAICSGLHLDHSLLVKLLKYYRLLFS